jgi:carbamoyltransferase
MKDIVNTKIKFREPFRPFAPSVLAERAEEFFVLPGAAEHYPARFMLYVVDVKADKQEALPAITHVDGTGRLQTVGREPIVNTPKEAFHTFTESGMDVLVLGDYVVEKCDGKGSGRA